MAVVATRDLTKVFKRRTTRADQQCEPETREGISGFLGPQALEKRLSCG